MEDSKIKGKVTIIIQPSIKTTKELESSCHHLLYSEGDWYLGDDEVTDISIVPSDVPYDE